MKQLNDSYKCKKIKTNITKKRSQLRSLKDGKRALTSVVRAINCSFYNDDIFGIQHISVEIIDAKRIARVKCSGHLLTRRHRTKKK